MEKDPRREGVEGTVQLAALACTNRPYNAGLRRSIRTGNPQGTTRCKRRTWRIRLDL